MFHLHLAPPVVCDPTFPQIPFIKPHSFIYCENYMSHDQGYHQPFLETRIRNQVHYYFR